MALWNILTAENKISETMDSLEKKKAGLRFEIEELVKSKMEEEYNKNFTEIIEKPENSKKYYSIVQDLYQKYLQKIDDQINGFTELKEQLGIK